MELLNNREKGELVEKCPLYSRNGKRGETVFFGTVSVTTVEMGYFSLSGLEKIEAERGGSFVPVKIKDLKTKGRKGICRRNNLK